MRSTTASGARHRLIVMLACALVAIMGVIHAHAQDAQRPADPPRKTQDAESAKRDANTPAQDTKSGETKPATKPKRARRPPADPHRPWGDGVKNGTYMGRMLAPVMSYLGADWLIRPEREIEEEPERMLDALEIQPGMTVADVGAGVGYTSVLIARRVGPTGRVLATDIQPEMIRMLRQNARQLKADRIIRPILCTAEDPKLPEGAVDIAIMVDVYHECTHPVETLRGIHKALKPEGRLVLVEFRAEDPDVPIKPEHKMTAAQAKLEVESQGFRLVKNHDFLPWQHILVFDKAPNTQTGAPTDSPPPETQTRSRDGKSDQSARD